MRRKYMSREDDEKFIAEHIAIDPSRLTDEQVDGLVLGLKDSHQKFHPYNLQKMKAGKELNSLVAEVVMGWKFKILDNGYGHTASYWVDKDTGEKKYPVNFYNPSSDIKQAIELMEYMGSMKIELANMTEGYEYLRYRVVAFNKEKGHKRTDEITGYSLAETICKAAVFSKLFV